MGEVDWKILDESMGAIGGQIEPFPAYDRYRLEIQDLSESKKGIVNSNDFEFAITIGENVVEEVVGGIGVTDLRELVEISVEAAGLHYDIIKLISN